MNVGLIGCGRIAQVHTRAYRSMKNVEVLAISDLDINKAKAFAREQRISGVYSNYVDLLELKDLDFVDVCTPTSTHKSIVLDAAKSGLSVLMEKPMARNSEDCEIMIQESRKHNVSLCVCHNQIFYPHVRRLKSIAVSEDFDLTSFRTFHKENFEFLKAHGLAHDWNVSPEHGGILWEVGCHLAYLQLHFLKDIEEVYATGVRAKYAVWDDLMVLLRGSSGHFGVMEISWIAKEPEMMYEIISSDGKRVQTYLPHGYIIDRAQRSLGGAGDVVRSFLSDEKRIFTKWAKFTRDQFSKPQLGHLDLIRSYVESLEKGSPSPVTGEDGRNAIRLLECIDQSLRDRLPVKYSAF